MQIDLPVHQSAGDEELLDGVDAFGFEDKFIVDDVHHFYQSGGGYVSFGHAAEERVPAEVVHAVHIELAGNELVQEPPRILIFEDPYRKVRSRDSLHHQQGYLFVGYTLNEGMLEYMGERSVSEIMEQDGNHSSLSLLVGDSYSFLPQGAESFLHKMHGSKGVKEAAMHSPGIDEIRQTELADTIESLHVRVLQDIVEQVGRDIQKSEDGIVNNFAFIRHIDDFRAQSYVKIRIYASFF